MTTLTFISWNVNGIRAVEKKEALKWIDETDVDFLGLQEIKAEADQIPETIFDRKYKFNSINSSSKKGQSGVALYTDMKGEDFSCDHVDILDEGRINEYHFGDIAYFNVYFPNLHRICRRACRLKTTFHSSYLRHDSVFCLLSGEKKITKEQNSTSRYHPGNFCSRMRLLPFCKL